MHPILFKFGVVTIYSYGLMVAMGFVVATALALRAAKIFDISPDRISNLSLVILISGIVGARIMYVMLNAGDFVSNPLEVFMVWHGGLVFYGGAIFAFFSGLVYLKNSKTPVLGAADVIAPYVALAHCLGRIGCFLNGCCFGRPTKTFFGIVFQDGVKRYPTQIYESVYLLFLYMFLRACLQFRRFKGQVFFSYLILYSAERFFMESLRGDSPVFFFRFTFSQVVSVAVLIFGICGYSLKKPHDAG